MERYELDRFSVERFRSENIDMVCLRHITIGLDISPSDTGIVRGMNSETVEKATLTASWLTLIITNLVDERDPDKIIIQPELHPDRIAFGVKVPPREIGKVIGRGGRIARALRTLLMARGRKDRLIYVLDIEERAAC